jgi:hypothetical protein
MYVTQLYFAACLMYIFMYLAIKFHFISFTHRHPLTCSGSYRLCTDGFVKQLLLVVIDEPLAGDYCGRWLILLTGRKFIFSLVNIITSDLKSFICLKYVSKDCLTEVETMCCPFWPL